MSEIIYFIVGMTIGELVGVLTVVLMRSNRRQRNEVWFLWK